MGCEFEEWEVFCCFSRMVFQLLYFSDSHRWQDTLPELCCLDLEKLVVVFLDKPDHFFFDPL